MKITALWPDGTIITAESWQELEDDVRGRQWQRYSPRDFRQVMAQRAANMTGARVRTDNAEILFRDLEAAKMLRLDVEDEP